jgi:hypothetical protein
MPTDASNIRPAHRPGYIGTDRYPATVPAAYNIGPPTDRWRDPAAPPHITASTADGRDAIRRILNGRR